MEAVGEARTDNLAAISTAPPTARIGWLAAVVIAAAFFAAAAPTLAWLEFSNTMENLVVAAALETRHTGDWIVPRLEGEPRLAKPPLATWIAAASIRTSTLQKIDDVDSSVRAAGYRALAWDVRWPSLLASCLSLLAIYGLSREIVGVSSGLLAMCIAGTRIYFARYGRQATTDVQLALWVAVANAALARMVLRRITWPGALLGGVAIGLAFMSKGPIALLMTIVPAAIYLCFAAQRPRVRWMPLIIAAIIFILIGGWWYAYVDWRIPAAMHHWTKELTVADSGEHAGNVFCYTSIFIYVLPWTAMFIFGLVWTCVEWRSRDRWLWIVLIVLLPAIAMSFFPERRERYLLPLLGPAALLVVRGLLPMLYRSIGPRIPDWVQWAVLFALAIGFPLAGMKWLRRADGAPWFAPSLAMGAMLVFIGVIVIALVCARFSRYAMIAATIVLMLMLEPLFYFGYRVSPAGHSDMRALAELIRDRYPAAEMYNWRPGTNKRASVDFSIYMNRPTRWTPDPAALARSRRPQIYITERDRHKPRPLGLPGWHYLASARRDANTSFVAYVRDSR